MQAAQAQGTTMQGKADAKGKGQMKKHRPAQESTVRKAGTPLAMKGFVPRQTTTQVQTKEQVRVQAPRRAGEGEVLSDFGAIYHPAEGKATLCERSGTNYYVSYGDLMTGSQAGGVEIVTCDDGTIYGQELRRTERNLCD